MSCLWKWKGNWKGINRGQLWFNLTSKLTHFSCWDHSIAENCWYTLTWSNFWPLVSLSWKILTVKSQPFIYLYCIRLKLSRENWMFKIFISWHSLVEISLAVGIQNIYTIMQSQTFDVNQTVYISILQSRFS
jgi:hypothetical protein